MTDRIEEEAELRQERHADHPTHRPLSEGYELVGLRGEEELARVFGGAVDYTPRPGGDGGKDMTLHTDCGSFPVDVKTARKPINLLVEEGKVKPRTIYVLAGISPTNTRLLGWEWAEALLKQEPRDFGYGVLSHAIHIADLREIAVLLIRKQP